ncbi:MAG: hypothetical protein D6785_15980 [Planctomycetota bacterium]|nr:MAG: hypothetical protein D6785_15980 [Planctomycetota bacterium]
MDIHNHLLLRKILEGDLESFKELAENHQTILFAVTLAWVGNPEKAKEEMVKIFQLLYNRLKQLKDFHHFLPFFISLASEFLEKAYSQVNPDFKELEPPLRNYLELLWTFPLESRMVFFLNFCSDLSYQEIAAGLNISENRVRGILAKMMKAFIPRS